jgi:hypothetical protein
MSGEQARNGEANQASQDALPCFLKFGDLPEGGFSYNGKFDMYEDGVAVFRGKRTRSGYVFDLPGGQDKEDEEDAFPPLGACVVLFSYIVAGRGLRGFRHGARRAGILGDPLLGPDSAVLKPVSHLTRVGVPKWVGPEAEKLVEDWSRWRRNDGGRNRGKRKGSKSAAVAPMGLLNQAALALAEAEARWDPSTALFSSREERIRELKRMLYRG